MVQDVGLVCHGCKGAASSFANIEIQLLMVPTFRRTPLRLKDDTSGIPCPTIFTLRWCWHVATAGLAQRHSCMLECYIATPFG